jgi:hypothetical protein
MQDGRSGRALHGRGPCWSVSPGGVLVPQQYQSPRGREQTCCSPATRDVVFDAIQKNYTILTERAHQRDELLVVVDLRTPHDMARANASRAAPRSCPTRTWRICCTQISPLPSHIHVFGRDDIGHMSICLHTGNVVTFDH